jgi:hypothetical protein
MFVPFSVAVFGTRWHYFFLAFAIFAWLITKCSRPSISVPIDFKVYFFILFFPIFLSLLIGLPTGIINNFNIFNYGDFIYEIFGRILNYIIIIFFGLLFLQVVFSDSLCGLEIEKAKNLIFYYWLGLFVFILFSYWQIAYEYFGLINFPFETRNNIHSVSESSDIAFGSRVTGIAREPSYLAPLLIDFIIISFFVMSGFRKIFASVFYALIPLLLTFSLGGYFNLIIVFFPAMLFYVFISVLKCKFNVYSLISIFASLISLIFIFIKLDDLGGLTLIFGRISGAFDLTEAGRFYMWIMPFVWLSTYSPVNILFGFGPKSYSMLGDYYLMPNGEPVHITSNNIFSDYAWEMGLVGLLSVIFLFCILVFQSFKIKMNRLDWIAGLLAFHLIVSSVYRADYASIRFHLIALLIVSICCLNRRNKNAAKFHKI